MTERIKQFAGRHKDAASVLGVIALVLVMWLTRELSYDVRAQRMDLDNLSRILAAHASETAYYMRAICINAAETPQKLANCQSPEKR